jgi:hypothetical protein
LRGIFLGCGRQWLEKIESNDGVGDMMRVEKYYFCDVANEPRAADRSRHFIFELHSMDTKNFCGRAGLT